MADSDKNILIKPNIASSDSAPFIEFIGADSATGDSATITLSAIPLGGGSTRFSSPSNDLLTITKDETGVIFSVNRFNDSGTPLIEVTADGLMKFGEFEGTVIIGGDSATDAADSFDFLVVHKNIRLLNSGKIIGDGSSLTSLTAANLTGALPALDGSSLTSLTAANLTGALPAISGASLTSVDADTLDGINSTSFLRSDAFDNVSGTLEFQDNVTLQFGGSGDTIIEHDTGLAPDGTRFYANTSTGGMLFQDGSTTCFDVAYTAANTTTFAQNVDFTNATVTGLSTGGGSGSGISGGVFLEYEKTVDSDYTIDSDGFGRGIFVLSAADDSDGLTIATGATVTVNSGSSWVLTGGDKNMGLDAMVATSNQTERTMRTGTIKPTLNDTYDLGDSAVQYRHVYTDEITVGKAIHQGFVLTSGQSGDQDPLNAWANYATQLSGDGAGQINRGGDITNTSGIFSYPVTGLYKIEFFASFAGGSTDSTVQFDIQTTQNNSAYSSITQVKDHTYGSSYKGNVAMTALHKVTDTTNDKFKFTSSSFSGHTTEGSTTEALTYFFITRLGNAS